MAPFLVVVCCAIVCLVLPVASDENDLNVHFAAYSPGMIRDVWHVPNDFLNEIPQLNAFDWFASGFPMPYDFQSVLERRNSFSLRIMNSSWNEPVDTKVFFKGEPLYLQVSASPAPGQQLYVQSCHASSSPNPADKPDVPLIINKGCVASRESLVKFVLQRSDSVNMVVHASNLKSSEVYLHCKLSLSDLGLTSVSKFCNYNKLKSRWIDLGGQTSVCDCCGGRCRSFMKHAELSELSAVVTTGPLIIKDQQSSQTTPSDYSTKSSPTARNMSDKRWIMAGASFSGSSKQNNVSPWPVQPGYGGGVVIPSQGLGSDFSMWLLDIMGLDGYPVVGNGYPENPADLMLERKDPKLKLDESLPGAVDGSEANVVAVNWSDVEGKAFVPKAEPHLNFESVFDLPLNDQSSVISTPDKLSKSAEDEAVFRQAEMVFKSAKGSKHSEPILYSRLSVNQAADGSSSLSYEELKRPSVGKEGDRMTPLEKDGEKRQKNGEKEVTFRIKDLVSTLLEEMRSV